MTTNVSRRSFLTGAAAAGGVATLSLLGVNTKFAFADDAPAGEAPAEEAPADEKPAEGGPDGGGKGGPGGGGPGGPGGAAAEPIDFTGTVDETRVKGYCGPGDWLGEAPQIADDEITSEQTYDVVIVGGGHSGLMAACGAVDEGATVAVIEMQPWASFVDLEGTGENKAGWYGEDIGHVNSKFLIDRGFGPFNTGEITAEFCKRAAGRVNPDIIRAFVQNSGAMFDRYQEIYEGYADARAENDSNVYLKSTLVRIPGEEVPDEGNFDMSNMFEYPMCNTQAAWSGAGVTYPISCGGYKTWPCNAQFYGYQGNNIEYIHKYIVQHTQENGADWYYETTGQVLTQNENGDVTGVIAQGPDGYIRFNANKGVILCAGDYIGDPAMCWALLNEGMEWGERTGATDQDWSSVGPRAGWGHKMGCWAGGMIEPTPRGWMGIGGGASGPWGTAPLLMINSEGKRFMNEGAIPQISATCLRVPSGLCAWVTDANWKQTVGKAPLDHGAPNFGMDDYMEALEADMNAVEIGNPEGCDVVGANLAERKMMKGTVYGAETLEELATMLGFEGDAATEFLATIEHYNELCKSEDKDTDYGKDADYMIPIETPPFYGGTGSLSHSSRPMMVTMSGLVTDGTQNVLTRTWTPIKGLYAAGNCLGGRYGFGYSTPFAGNSIGMAMTHGWLAGKTVANL